MFAILHRILLVIVNDINWLTSNSKHAVIIDSSILNQYPISTGVLQGDILTPFLFDFFM